MTTLAEAQRQYLQTVEAARSANTHRTYAQALTQFAAVLADHGCDTATVAVADLPDSALPWFIAALRGYAASSERLYLTAVTGFYEFLAASGLADPNLARLRLLIRQRARRPGVRLPQFPRAAIERVLTYAEGLAAFPVDDEAERLRNLRDRAFLLTLADTGLRVHEACRLRRGDLDIHEAQALVIGKGDREAVVRFSRRALRAIADYLGARAARDGASGKPLGSLAIFARHDRGAGSKIRPITTTTGRDIVRARVSAALGEAAAGTITPHSFRHYFVTVVLRGSGGNLKLAQELARHQNIQVTTRYAHLSSDELDRGYSEIFDPGKKPD